MKFALILLLALLVAELAIANLLLTAIAIEPVLVNLSPELRSTPTIANSADRLRETGSGDISWALPATWEEAEESDISPGSGEEVPLPGPSYVEPIPLNQLDDQEATDGSGSSAPFDFSNSLQDHFKIDALARSYFLNDQRVEWSGMETTFGAEAAVRPQYQYQADNWIGGVVGDFYINQPFDRNMFVNSPERRSYLSNFRPDIFEISNLYLSLERENWYLAAGKFETPFGRTYFPLYTNSRIDAPFIRTEAIRWRETGLLARYSRDHWVCDVAFTNGGFDRDANASKALVTRLGMDFENASFGFSYKTQDGIGSEEQKTFNNHIGADFMIQRGRFRLSGEVIYDQYGFRRPGYDPDDIFWDRSIYYRDVNKAFQTPCEGWGYYVNLDYMGERWTTTLNYGEYYPDKLGIAPQDEINRRGIVKASYRLNRVLQSYTVVMSESAGYMAQDNRARLGFVILGGFQASF